jgi:hypothetical protein
MYTLLFCESCSNKIKKLGEHKLPEIYNFYAWYHNICSVYVITKKPVLYSEDSTWGKVVSLLEKEGYVISTDLGVDLSEDTCSVVPKGHWHFEDGSTHGLDRFCHAENISDHFGID